MLDKRHCVLSHPLIKCDSLVTEYGFHLVVTSAIRPSRIALKIDSRALTSGGCTPGRSAGDDFLLRNCF